MYSQAESGGHVSLNAVEGLSSTGSAGALVQRERKTEPAQVTPGGVTKENVWDLRLCVRLNGEKWLGSHPALVGLRAR